jgi:Zn-dependent protease
MRNWLRRQTRRRRLAAPVLWRHWVLVPAGHRLELRVHLGCLVTIALISGLLARVVLPTLFPGWHAGVYWAVAGWIAVADSLAGLLHELGHAAVALAAGQRVYRISLYGFAAAARRSTGHAAHEQLLIALAGPLSHLLLGAVFWAIWQLAPLDNVPLRVAILFPAIMNLLVGGLNLLPVRPLDGGRVVRALAMLAMPAR